MKANLLLIDDSEVQSSQITESLERLGYSVQRAASGAEGLRFGSREIPRSDPARRGDAGQSTIASVTMRATRF